MKRMRLAAGFLAALALTVARAAEVQIHVQADRVLQPISPFLTGACIEDVNHEIYGGLYSQMLFGEGFQEPAATLAPLGFKAYGGEWLVQDQELHFSGAPGDKLISDLASMTDGEVGIEIFMADRSWSNAGLLVRVSHCANGVDQFDGYEIALNAASQSLRLGRHRHNWEPIRDAPCEVPVGQWSSLTVKLQGRIVEVFLNGKSIIRFEDQNSALVTGTIGLRGFQREARYRNLWIKRGGEARRLPFAPATTPAGEVSGMWRALQSGSAVGSWSIAKEHPFGGAQSQALTFTQGTGEVGVENQGLNRWGLNLVNGKPYEGLVWARAAGPSDLWVALEGAEGTLAERRLPLKPGGWQRFDFSVTPKSADTHGRFTIKLKHPGSVNLAYAFLQPGKWGRFQNLPVRRDVAEALVAQGITVLRYGGSMVNAPEYRWKKMRGPRDQRPYYHGTWYPHSSNGWGILDFMEFCEAAGFEYVPDFNMGESPQDMADFVEYATGSAASGWGRKRAADGHPKPFRLHYIELGNEEKVDGHYLAAFEPMAQAIWAKDPKLILVVGDFAYHQRIVDPYNFRGADSRITNLAAHVQLLRLAKNKDREIWFDVHVGTDGPRPDSSLEGMFSFQDALDKFADAARHRVVVFELNAGNHAQRRALANAIAIQAIERNGRIPIVTSANCLQPDGQNDNGWDQGLLFLNPARVWLQPPGYVSQMLSRNYLPNLVQCDVTAAETPPLHVTAKRSADGRTLVLEIVNPAGQPVPAQITLAGFVPRKPEAQVTELAGPLDAVNTANRTDTAMPKVTEWRHRLNEGFASRNCPPHSFTVLRFE